MSNTIRFILAVAGIWAILTIIILLVWHWLMSINSENMSAEWRQNQAKKDGEEGYGEKEKRS
jgi:hypothetical protein